jgi:sec-independent protein translocase protein TatA
MPKGIGVTELIIIAVILLVLFGGKKLPELGKGIGEAIKEVKGATKEKDDKKTKKKE